MTEYSHSRAALDEKRRKLNEKSEGWATRRKVAWTPEEDAVIINEWLPVRSTEERHEEEISRKLSRTVFACQGRAQHLREVLGLTGHSHCTAAPEAAARPVCGGCFMELPVVGVCPDCG